MTGDADRGQAMKTGQSEKECYGCNGAQQGASPPSIQGYCDTGTSHDTYRDNVSRATPYHKASAKSAFRVPTALNTAAPLDSAAPTQGLPIRLLNEKEVQVPGNQTLHVE
ncbi:hypothetical protein B9Z55_028172 [Caenorhabditis nigoni]|uniref:Uncharacterized protein n=1 Tax=Caenorhabditis nigoni TaxID=1611254 RepID=A0A2G5SD04_9PELO|nr:hypothetical protein B9Z55_028172 [Caenorhabditis nigoni]